MLLGVGGDGSIRACAGKVACRRAWERSWHGNQTVSFGNGRLQHRAPKYQTGAARNRLLIWAKENSNA